MNDAALSSPITGAHGQALAAAAGAVKRHLILRNWLIGAHLVEFEQQEKTGQVWRRTAQARGW